MRVVFLPFATDLTKNPDAGSFSRGLARDLAARVGAVEGVETVFRPFVQMVDGKRRFAVYAEPWSGEDLVRLLDQGSDSGGDFLVQGTLDLDDPFRLEVSILHIPDFAEVAEESFEAPRFNGFEAVEKAVSLVLSTVGRAADAAGEFEYPTRTFDGWIHLLRGRDAAAALDGWGDPDDPEAVFDPYLSALELEPKLAVAREELAFHAVRAAGAGLLPVEAAESAIRRLLDMDPKCREGWTALGRIRAVAGDLTGAEEALKKALELDPGRAALRYELGALHLQQGRPGRAAKMLETVKADPQVGASALFELGAIRAEKNDREGAIELWREAAERDPENAMVWATLGRALSSLGRFDEAEAAFHRGLEAERPSWVLHLGFGEYLAEQDRHAEAIPQLSKALEVEGADALAHMHLGRCYEASGDTYPACHHLRKAVQAGGEFGEKALRVLGEFSDADREKELVKNLLETIERPASDQVVLLKALLKEEAAFADAQIRLGLALLAVKKPRAAEKQFRRVLKKLPEDPEARSGLGTALKTRGKLKAAAEAHREALKLRPNHAPYHLNLADTLFRMGRVREAAREVDVARALAPGHPLLPGFVLAVKAAMSTDPAPKEK